MNTTDVFNSSHNSEITIEGTHACKGANELNKQLLSIHDVPEQVYEPLFLALYTHTHLCINTIYIHKVGHWSKFKKRKSGLQFFWVPILK